MRRSSSYTSHQDVPGPDAYLYPGVSVDLAAALAKDFDVPEGRNPFEVADAALEDGATDEAVRRAIRAFLEAQSPSPVIALLAKTRWSAILSFSLDSHLEFRLSREAEKSPTRHKITVLEDASQIPPPRSVPAYKLLGTADRDRFAYSTTTYLMRKTGWRRIIKDFADRVKESAVLCLGLGECLSAFQELLAEMASQSSAAPSNILFLGDDPLHENLTIRRLIGQKSRITTVKGSLGDLVKAASRADKLGYAPVLPFTEDQPSPYHELKPFHELAIVVNEYITTDILAEQHQQLLEMLFSPDIPSWAPIVHGLDFRRGLIDGLMLDIRRILSSLHPEFSHAALVIHGRAASGKTMLLKRLAWEIAKGEDLVIWLRPIFAGEAGHSLRHLFEKIAKIKALRGRRVIVFLDDPVKSTVRVRS